MSHRKKTLTEQPLVPMPDFENVVKKVITTPKQQVELKLAAFQTSNKVRRDQRKIALKKNK